MVTNSSSSFQNDELTNYWSLFDEILTKNWKRFGGKFEKLANFLKIRSREECGNCRSRQGLSNAYLVEKIGLDTDENGPVKV